MRYLLVLPLLFVSGCAQKEIIKALDDIHQDCVRHYTFNLSSGMAGVVGNANVAGTLDCQPAGVTTTVTTSTVKQP
jgi:hypothetical protein